MMEWFIAGIKVVAAETPTEPRTIVLPLDPDNDALDGAIVTCRATLSDGREVEKSITITVKGIYKYIYIYLYML